MPWVQQEEKGNLRNACHGAYRGFWDFLLFVDLPNGWIAFLTVEKHAMAACHGFSKKKSLINLFKVVSEKIFFLRRDILKGD